MIKFKKVSSTFFCSFIFLLLISKFSSAQYAVTWKSSYYATINGSTLTQDGSGNIGYGTASNFLFPKNPLTSNVTDGYVSYTISTNLENKTFGLVVLNKSDFNFEEINYSFNIPPRFYDSRSGTFVQRLYVKCNGLQYLFYYNVGDQLKIDRTNSTINFYKNSTLLISKPCDPTELLAVRSKVESQNSQFANITCSFPSTIAFISPTINNSTKTMVVPNTISNDILWKDGDNDLSTTKIEAGTYDFSQVSASNNLIRGSFSVGEEVDWGSFNNTQLFGTDLSLVNQFSTGNSKSRTDFSNDMWIESTVPVESNGASKAWGYILPQNTPSSLNRFEAGYYLNGKNHVQIIYNGAIISKHYCEDNFSLRIERNNGKWQWFINGRQILEKTVLSSTYKIGGLILVGTSISGLRFGIKSVAHSSFIWDDNIGLGDITIDASSFISSGYSYRISEKLIVSKLQEHDDYSAVFTDIPNWTIYQRGETNQNSRTFKGYPAGNYNASVFNDNGERLFSNEFSVYPPVTFGTQSNLLIDRNVISSSGGTSYGDLQWYYTDSDQLNVEFDVMTQGTEQFFGLIPSNGTITNKTHLKYGFYIASNNLYLIVNGVQIATNKMIRWDANLSISIDKGSLQFILNEDVIGSYTMPLNSYYKIGVGGYNMGKFKISSLIKLPWPGKLVKPMHSVLHATCESDLGKINIALNGGGYPSSYKYSYSIINLSNSQLIAGGSVPSILSSPGLISVPVGEYSVQCIIRTSANVYVTTVYSTVFVGYETEWQDIDMYNLTPNTYSLERDNQSSGTFSRAKANHVLFPNEKGWIRFVPVHPTVFSGSNHMRLTTMNPNAIPQSANWIANESSMVKTNYIAQLVFSLGNYITLQFNLKLFVTDGVSTQAFTITPGKTIMLKIDNPGGVVMVYQDNSYLGSFTTNSSLKTIRCHTSYVNAGFDNIVSSFDCTPDQSIMYVSYHEMKRNLDGSYAHAVEGILKFTVDEEYQMEAGSKLPLKIYDDNHQLLESSDINGNTLNSSITPLDYKFDDNRWTLDISNVAGMQVGNFYTIVIENSKGDKRFLRFLYKN